jgi:glycopeptide antibiotics resistance protein
VAPRTVSLNDIVAEIAGTLVGLAVWAIFGRRPVRTAQDVLMGGPQALRAAVILYLLAYCFVTLFPFDFLVTSAELHARMADPKAIVWIPRGVSSMRGLVSLLLKAALMAPLGAVVRLVWQRGMAVTLVAAFALSGLLEIVHWFEYSGQTDALSIAVAMAGAAAGNLFVRSALLFEQSLTPWIRRAAMLAAPFYLALLPVVRGWKHAHASRALIEQTLASTHWLPFYYHYYSSEGHALASFVSISASFVPLGVLAWAMRLQPGESAGRARSFLPVAIVAFFLALILEAGGLITADNRPDPTNVLIAMGIAVFSQRACEWLARVLDDFPATARVLS